MPSNAGPFKTDGIFKATAHSGKRRSSLDFGEFGGGADNGDVEAFVVDEQRCRGTDFLGRDRLDLPDELVDG